mgnify:CR=1 FL=1
MMKVIVQKAAARQISRVYTYGEQHFGKQAAEKTHARIMEALRLLAANPRLGITEPLLAGRKREYRSIVVHKLFKLVYYVKDETLYIAALWDTRREPRTQADNTK